MTTLSHPRLSAVAALALALLAAACADAPSAAPTPAAPSAPPALARAHQPRDTTTTATTVLADVGTAEGLLRTQPLAQAVTTRFVVTPLGGVFSLPGTGLTVLVPPGAHPSGPLTITATAVPGRVVAYEFEPHGTTFALPLVAVQDLRATNWLSRGEGAGYDVGYFASHTDLNPSAGTARVRELLPRTIDFLNTRLVFQVPHFSGYMVSWGFR